MAGILLAICRLFYFQETDFSWVSQAIWTTQGYAWPASKVDKDFVRAQIKKILFLSKDNENIKKIKFSFLSEGNGLRIESGSKVDPSNRGLYPSSSMLPLHLFFF